MVNIPKEKRTYCKNCKKHTKQKVSLYKAGKRRGTGQGDRRYKLKQKGYGGQTRPVFHKNAKTTKKVVLKYTCTKCKAARHVIFGRSKKVELGAPTKKDKGSGPSW